MDPDWEKKLYELLPALYRIKDAENGYPLKAVLDLVGAQADIVKENIEGLWDDFFIETCAPWVIPYIADLVGNNPIHEVAQRRRADVAKTIYYRRRKGTLAMLEEMAGDVTGWGAHAVAFFELMGWTQHLNHLRCQPASNVQGMNPNAVDRVGTVNLRSPDALDWLDGPFDPTTHTADVRPVSSRNGWHNIHDVGFFLWRLGVYPMHHVTPRQASGVSYGYHFSPLGHQMPLFNQPQREVDPSGLAHEIHVPGPIRPRALAQELERCRQALVAGTQSSTDYYGESGSLCLFVNGEAIPPESVVCMDLGQRWEPPPDVLDYPDGSVPIQAGVDVRTGRLVLTDEIGPEELLQVSCAYGFSADMGGGPYSRRDVLADPEQANLVLTVGANETITSLGNALDQWRAEDRPNTIIQIADNGVYEEAVGEPLALADDRWLVIQAANRCRPVIRLEEPGTEEPGTEEPGTLVISGANADSAMTLNGLVLEGGLHITGGLGSLTLNHCTLVPGYGFSDTGEPLLPDQPSILVAPSNPGLELKILQSITGALQLPADMKGLIVQDSIVDGLGAIAIGSPDGEDEFGPPATLERATLFGQVFLKELTLATEVIFDGVLQTQRLQSGCVRFSYVPEDSQTPRRFRCQPDLILEGVSDPGRQRFLRVIMQPGFASIHYGDPAYAQLSRACPQEIKTGAEDESEIGAFCSLKQPQRIDNLNIRLSEYLPFGLRAGNIFVT
jgi:hypothetical protein